MPNASAPFKAKAPFHSRILGLDYQSFGLDFINPPFPNSFGCLSVTPDSNFNSSGVQGGPFGPPSNIYTLSNVGRTTMSWSLTLSQAWLVADVTSGTIAPGDSQNVTVTLNADALPESPTPYTGTLAFVNTTNACGNTTVGINLSVTGNLTLTVQGRSKGGTATILGYSEYVSPSTPPKKYTLKTFSGVRDARFTSATADCSGSPSCWITDTLSGTCTWNLTTNSEDNTGGQYNRVQTAPTCTGTLAPGVYPSNTIGSPSTLVGDSQTFTQTTNSISNLLFPCYSDGGQSLKRTACNPEEVISVEDTESAAISRLMASTSYSSWATVVTQGGIKSLYEARTTGFAQQYQYAQWQVGLTGLTPLTIYNGSAIVYRRLQGTSGAWAFVSTQVLSGSTDISGNFTDGPFDLPEARGYEYTVWNASLTP